MLIPKSVHKIFFIIITVVVMLTGGFFSVRSAAASDASFLDSYLYKANWFTIINTGVTITFEVVGDNINTLDGMTATFESDNPGTFDPSSCTLSGDASSASCSVTYTPTQAGEGTHTITVKMTGDYYYSNNSTRLLVKKVKQTITFAPLADKIYGDPDFDLVASSDSGLPVVFNTGTSDRCALTSASTIHLIGGGSCTITVPIPLLQANQLCLLRQSSLMAAAEAVAMSKKQAQRPLLLPQPLQWSDRFWVLRPMVIFLLVYCQRPAR
jgi:hypothetical protein